MELRNGERGVRAGSALPRDPGFQGHSRTFCQISSNCSTPSDTFLRQRSISLAGGSRRQGPGPGPGRSCRSQPRSAPYLGACACPPWSLPYGRALFMLPWRRPLRQTGRGRHCPRGALLGAGTGQRGTTWSLPGHTAGPPSTPLLPSAWSRKEQQVGSPLSPGHGQCRARAEPPPAETRQATEDTGTRPLAQSLHTPSPGGLQA